MTRSVRFELIEWGAAFHDGGPRSFVLTQSGWARAPKKMLLSDQETTSRKLKKWLKDAMGAMKARGTFTLYFKPTGNRKVMFVSLSFQEGKPDRPPHFRGPEEEALALAVKAASRSFLKRGRNMSGIHPAIAAMEEDVWKDRARREEERQKDEEIRIFAEELARQGLTPEKLDDMKPKLRAACESVIRKNARTEAVRRAETLLVDNLDKDQRREWEEKRAFRVDGSDGICYRIANAGHYNVRSMTRPAWDYCLNTVDPVPRPDQLLVQKLMIESDAEGFRKVANRMRASNERVQSINRRMDFRESLQEALDEVAASAEIGAGRR